MYNTSDMKTNAEKSNKKVVFVNTNLHCTGYNPFQTGHGCHEKTKKAKHKSDRKNARLICKAY